MIIYIKNLFSLFFRLSLPTAKKQQHNIFALDWLFGAWFFPYFYRLNINRLMGKVLLALCVVFFCMSWKRQKLKWIWNYTRELCGWLNCIVSVQINMRRMIVKWFLFLPVCVVALSLFVQDANIFIDGKFEMHWTLKARDCGIQVKWILIA